jgi:hypothetical protein
MSDRRGVGLLAVLAVFAVGLAARTWLLQYSPLPATLDGVRYAALARETLATGGFPFAHVDSDELVFTSVIALASAVTGVDPLHLAQPVTAVLGAAAGLTGMVIAVAVARGFGWSGRRLRYVGVLAGLTLAVEGLFLRRTGVPDEEVAALLLVSLVALAALHNFSTAIAALVVTALVAVHVTRDPTRRTTLVGGAIALGFWGLFLGYFTLAEWLGLRLTYSGLLRDHPGLFVAWVLVLAVGSAWFQRASKRGQRTAFLLPFGVLFAVVAVNLARPVFPETIATPTAVLALVLLFAVPVALFGWGVPRLSRRRLAPEAGPFVYALAAGPLAMVWFTLTTALTPEFFGASMRAQSFAHHAVFALAAVVAVGVATRERWRSVGRVLVLALVLVAVVSMPLGYVHLDNTAYPATIHESEFDAASFARTNLPESYTSDHRLSQLGSLYYFTGANATPAPTRTWLVDGRPPACPTIVQRVWTRSGAHFYPTPAQTLPTEEYRRWIATNHAVYDTGGYTKTTLVVPLGNRSRGC